MRYPWEKRRRRVDPRMVAPSKDMYKGLYSVDFDGATDQAVNSAAAAFGPDTLASGTVALWVKTTDASGTIIRWWDTTNDNRLQIMMGTNFARMFVEMNTIIEVNTTGTVVINDGAWHLIGMTWTWAVSAQLWVDGATDGAADVCADSWVAPAMSEVGVGLGMYDGQIAHAGVWPVAKDAAWWAAAYASPRQHWPEAAHDWQMGDRPSDRPDLVTIEDFANGLNLTTASINAANLFFDHP